MGGRETGRRSATPWFLAVPPDVRAEWIARKRLSAALDHEIATHAAVIVEAPSGYGKTVALTAWVRSRAEPTGWLTLTALDADAAQLLSGVLTALIRVHPDDTALAALMAQHHDGDLSTSRAVMSLIELMHDSRPETVLIIDDTHFTSPEAFTAVVLPIIQFSRGRLRLALAATGRIRRWLSRSIVFGDISLLLPTTLAFTPEEVAEVQQHAGTRDAEMASEDQLWEETKGWPVAVALALQGGPSHPLESMGNHEQIAYHVETTVLAGLRTDLRDFILAATTSNRLNGDFAAQLSGREDASTLLEECRDLGLFLDRFQHDSAGLVYRWHSTFAQSCRSIQARHHPDRFREQHERAATWLAPRFPAEAVSHALEAGNAELAVSILEDNWLQLICGGQAGILATACAQVPTPWHDVPALSFIRACCLDVNGDRVGSQLLASRARSALRTAEGHDLVRARAAQAFAELFLVQDQPGLQAAAEHAYSLLTGHTLTTNQYVHGLFLVGWSEMRLRRNPARAIKLLATAAHEAHEAGFDVLAGRAYANLAFALTFGGRFTDSQTALRSLVGADGVDEWDYYDGGVEVMAAIHLAYWRSDLDTVLRLTRSLHARGGHGSSYAALGRVFFVFAVANLREPILYAEAENMLLDVGNIDMHGVPWPAYRAIGEARLAMARSDHGSALAALSRITDWTAIPTTLVMAAEIYRRLGQHDRAISLLRGLSRPEMVSYIYVSTQFTTAALAWEREDRAAAHKALERSVKVAAAEGITAPFVELDEIGRELLVQHSAWGTEYEGFVAARVATGANSIRRSDLISTPLSAREREVFSYLGTTMTAEEIAAELHVSVNTVRSHQRSIYRKLGVSTRREAIRVRL